MKTKNTKLNVKLLRKVQKHILDEPRRFLMDTWVFKARSQKDWDEKRSWFNDASPVMPPCKTAACIAGTVNLLTGGRKLDAVTRAAKLLGVQTMNELNWDEDHPLFIVEGWPEKFANRYKKAKTPKLRAKIACARIDAFIKENAQGSGT